MEVGRVALVTGGSRGIGAAICTALARSGHRVAVNFHSREDAANSLVAAIEREGGTAIAVAGDVANAGSVERMVHDVEHALGPVQILVNNAALTYVHKPWQEIDEAEWDAVMAVNLKSCFLCFRAIRNQVVHRRGNVLWQTSPWYRLFVAQPARDVVLIRKHLQLGLGANRAGRHGVDRDPLASNLARQAPRKPDHAGFGGHIVDQVRAT